MLDKNQLLPQVVQIAQMAGKEILKYVSGDIKLEIRVKQDETLVTEADMVAHETITTELGKLTPSIPILSEEAPDVSYEERQTWDYYWLVDPLDGTRDFIDGKNEFTINIALIKKNRAELGVIHVPISQRTYFASSDSEAYKQTQNKNPEPIRTLQTSEPPFDIVASRFHGQAELKRFLRSFPQTKVHHAGSALKFCLVAEGKAHMYPRFAPTWEWDSAAGQCIVERAGGVVMDLHQNPLRYNCKQDLKNPYFIVLANADLMTDHLTKLLSTFL